MRPFSKKIYFMSIFVFWVIFPLQGEIYTIKNTDLEISFDSEKKYPLANFSDMGGNYNFLTYRENSVFWEIIFLTQTNKELACTSLESGYSVTQESNKEISLLWENASLPEYSGTFDVTIKVVLKNRLSFWTINIKNRTKANIHEVYFPRINNIQKLYGQDHFVRPKGYHDKLYKDPFKSLGEQGYFYPGIPMQFFAYYGKKNGLYMATYDSECNAKKYLFDFNKQKNMLSFSVIHFPHSPDKGPNNYSCTYPVVLGSFDGDWNDAAFIYRRWAKKQKWLRKGPVHKRDDIPEWVDNAPVWLKFYNEARVVAPQCAAWREYLGVPVAVHWPAFQIAPFDKRYPEFYPACMDFRKANMELKKIGVYSLPYINAMIRDTWFTESWYTREGFKGEIKSPSGSPTRWQAQNTRMTVMCPGSSIWQNKILSNSMKTLVEYNAKGIYYDQISATGGRFRCFDRNHSHKTGGGNFWTNSYRKILEEVHKSTEHLNPRPVLTSEGSQEGYIDYIHANYMKSGGPANLAIPLYAAVYNKYTINYTHLANARFFTKLKPDAFRYLVSLDYTYGNFITNWDYGGNHSCPK